MKFLILFAITIIVVFSIQINGAVYDRRFDHRRHPIDDRLYDRVFRSDNLDEFRYRDALSRELYGSDGGVYERIRLEKRRRYPGDHDPIHRNHVRERFPDDRLRDRSQYDIRKQREQQKPNQFWENGRKYEVINGKTFEVFDAGNH